MAQESCNLDKEETEILKPSSSSSSSPSPSPSPSPAHKEETAEKMKPLSSSSSSSTPPKSSSSSPPPLFVNSVQEFSAQKLEKLEKAREESKPLSRLANRCSNCKKKVGLTGFRCRCGELFCGQHRYSDIHDCSFDYKALAREQISKENPVIRPAKIIKI